MLFITVTSVFISVALPVGGLLYLFLTRRSVIQERLDKLAPHRTEIHGASLIREQPPLQRALARVGEKFPTSDKGKMLYSRLLVASGYRKESLPIFLASKIILTLLLPGLFILFYSFPRGIVLNTEMLLYEIILAILGFLLPSFWLQRKFRLRTTEIFHTLPDILDLLTVCVEAGMSIDAALIKACENPQFKGNPLAEELKTAGMETRAGKPRADALRDMAERTMVEDVMAFVTMLIQTERFGTSLSLSLRVHSDSLRTKRRQIAEEAAAKTAVKMLFPLAFFVFPALLVVILGPAVLMFKNLF